MMASLAVRQRGESMDAVPASAQAPIGHWLLGGRLSGLGPVGKRQVTLSAQHHGHHTVTVIETATDKATETLLPYHRDVQPG
jgi:hypothetical protein